MPGATRIISVLPQIIMNIVDYGEDLQAAIDEPRIHYRSPLIQMESRLPTGVRRALQRMGYTLEVKGPFDLYFGGAQGILIDPQTGRMQGGAPTRGAQAPWLMRKEAANASVYTTISGARVSAGRCTSSEARTARPPR